MSFWKNKKQPQLHLVTGVVSGDGAGRKKSSWNIAQTGFVWVLSAPFYIGGLVIDSLVLLVKVPVVLSSSIYSYAGKEFRKTRTNWPVRKFRLKSYDLSFGLATMLLAGVFLTSVAGVGALLSDGLSLKGRVLGEAVNAVGDLQAGQAKLLDKDYEAASSKFIRSWKRFEAAQAEVSRSSLLLKAAAVGLPVGRDGLALLDAGSSLSKIASDGALLVSSLQGMSFSEKGLASDSGNLDFQQIQDIYSKIEQQLTFAADKLSSVDPGHLPAEYQDQVSGAKLLVDEYRQLLPIVNNLMTVTGELARGQKHVLVLLQNSNELRPTGGFMGTYGGFDMQDGYITSQKISSIYDLDGQLKEEYLPPLPVLAVNDRWYMRDSNWFFNFPESARITSEFYASITDKVPDFVVAMTPKLVTELLEVTGPVSLPKYGVVLEAENFVEVTQVQTSVEYDREQNKPKEMLSDFFSIFLGKLSELDAGQKRVAFQKLLASFASRDIQVFSRNENVERALVALGWSGQITDTSRDYLAIVSSNLGGSKTDLFLETKVQLQSKVYESGKVINQLQMVRRNPLPNSENLVNKSFVRVYVPEGSRLVSSSGFDSVNLDEKFELTGQQHPAVTAWESGAVKSVATGLLVGVESGKTFFGGWVVTKGGEAKEVRLEYELPYQLSSVDRQSLVVEKQGGALPYEFEYKLAFPGRKMLLLSENEDEVENEVLRKWEVGRNIFFGGVLK